MILARKVSQADQASKNRKDLPLPWRYLVLYGAAASPVCLSRNKVSPALADPLPIVIFVYLVCDFTPTLGPEADFGSGAVSRPQGVCSWRLGLAAVRILLVAFVPHLSRYHVDAHPSVVRHKFASEMPLSS
jgi:hypothetical protein